MNKMTCNGYYNSFRAMRLNVKEEELKDKRLKELQVQEDKTMGIWAKKQLRIEQQIITKQSPLQRARKIRNKRQEEINRVQTNEYNTCEKKLSKRPNNILSEGKQEASLENTNLVLPDDIPRSGSSISLPALPVKEQTRYRSKSLPILFHNQITSSHSNNRRLLLPTINGQLPAEACHKTRQSFNHQKLPPLKINLTI